MPSQVKGLQEKTLGATLRKDAWWVGPLVTGSILTVFGIYSTLAAALGTNYEWGPYLSPFYSPLFQPEWWPLSPAFLILGAPLGFRATCYYYRKAYYRAFFMDPVACAVGEARHSFQGETKLFLFQNLHRFFFYLALALIFILSYDAFLAMRWPAAGISAHGEMMTGPKEFGVGLGTLVMVLNAVFLGGYTLGCHSFRHLVGGSVDCFSCTRFGKIRYQGWKIVSFFNRRHMALAWTSLIWVGLTDLYIRLCAMGIISDPRLI